MSVSTTVHCAAAGLCGRASGRVSVWRMAEAGRLVEAPGSARQQPGSASVPPASPPATTRPRTPTCPPPASPRGGQQSPRPRPSYCPGHAPWVRPLVTRAGCVGGVAGRRVPRWSHDPVPGPAVQCTSYTQPTLAGEYRTWRLCHDEDCHHQDHSQVTA